jgi:hypothetical protein
MKTEQTDLQLFQDATKVFLFHCCVVAFATTRITGLIVNDCLFSLYIDDIIRRWQIEVKDKFYINNIEINTLLFADDQVILANSRDNLQRAIHRLN